MLDFGTTFYIINATIPLVLIFSALLMLLLAIPSDPELNTYYRSRKVMAYAYLIFGIFSGVNALVNGPGTSDSDMFIVAVFSLIIASFQSFLFTYTLIILINPSGFKKRWVAGQLISISSFSILVLLLLCLKAFYSQKIAFFCFLAFYFYQLIYYTYTFIRANKQYRSAAGNYFSGDEAKLLNWVTIAFFSAFSVGILVLVLIIYPDPVFDLAVAVLCALFYIYFLVKYINYPYVFSTVTILKEDVNEDQDQATDQETTENKKLNNLPQLIEQWVSSKAFTESGITIITMANSLNTNRTYLSTYINNNDTTIKCHKGTKEGDMTTIKASPDMTLSDIRKILEEKKFITPDRHDAAYRFISQKTKAQRVILDDVLAPINSENHMPVHTALDHGNQLVITDWLRKKSPDLVGFACNWWQDRHLSVRCILNDTNLTAQMKNEVIGAFHPIMLTDVIPTSNNVIGFYNNILVCLEGSVVKFEVKSWGAAGFNYRITNLAVNPVIKNVNKIFKGDYNKYVTADAGYWQSTKRLIEIQTINKLNISKDKTIAYQKLTFRSCNIVSYETDDGKIYRCDAQPPPLTDQDIKSTNPVLTGPRKSIIRHRIAKGEESDKKSGIVYDVKKGNEPLGYIEVYLLAFKSYEEAMSTIQALNTPDPNIRE